MWGARLFEPELFGLTADQYRGFAGILVTPLLGFVFLYFMGLPLAKLPLIGNDIKYAPPRWVLPFFAIGSLFIATLASSIGFTLSWYTAEPNASGFVGSFQKVIELPVPPGALTQARLTISDFDQLSNFRVFVNNYRVFGSSADCLMRYQCRPIGDADARSDYLSAVHLEAAGHSVHAIYSLNSLPHIESIGEFLVRGQNNIDVHIENSGVSDCSVQLGIQFTFADGTVLQPSLHVDGAVGASGVQTLPDGQPLYVFHASASTPKQRKAQIEPYGTYASNPSYRLCERIRFAMSLSDRNLDLLRDWARQRQANRLVNAFCQIGNFAMRYCVSDRSRR